MVEKTIYIDLLFLFQDPLIRRLERSHLMPAAELSQVLHEPGNTVVQCKSSEIFHKHNTDQS